MTTETRLTRRHEAAIPEADRAIYRAAGYGARIGFGTRPVVLVIDVTYEFVGDRPEPVLESIRRWRNSCGEVGWEGISGIRSLLDLAHANAIPVCYLQPAVPSGVRLPWANDRLDEADVAAEVGPLEIVREIAPAPGDAVFPKSRPSAFNGTELLAHLIAIGADTLIVAGVSTSGCVRASVVDAFSYSYRVGVVEEATFDRSEFSHQVSMFDMDQKYADVVSLDEVAAYFVSLAAGG